MSKYEQIRVAALFQALFELYCRKLLKIITLVFAQYMTNDAIIKQNRTIE